MIDDAMGFVDVMERTVAQTARRGIIFLAGDIVVRLVEQFQRTVIATLTAHMSIDRGMIIQVLAVINRSVFDLSDGAVNFVDGALFFVIDAVGRREPVQVSPGVTQVGQRVQVCRMPPWFVGPGQCGRNGK